MFTYLKLPLALFVLGSALAPDASAGGIGFSISKHGKHGSIGVTIGNGWNAPAPTSHYKSSKHYSPPRAWTPGCYETIVEKVWVAGHEERVWIAPVHETRYDSCGRPYSVCVRPGHWQTVCTPGHYEYRNRQVWREGSWKGPCG